MDAAFILCSKMLFRLKWCVMSREKKYACLWARTRSGMSRGTSSP